MTSAAVLCLPRQVVQRDGRCADFDAARIRSAMARAGAASGEFGDDEAALLTAQVTKVLVHRFHGEAPAIEQIQDVVEQTLIAANHLQTARAYMAYRQRHAQLRADRQTLVCRPKVGQIETSTGSWNEALLSERETASSSPIGC